jgi:hypothetical protein
MRVTVKVGQVWEDNDPRGYGRQLKVVAIEGAYAICEVVYAGRFSDVVAGTRRKILLRRMRPNSKGYRLVEFPPS